MSDVNQTRVLVSGALRRVVTKLAVNKCLLPTSFYLEGVRSLGEDAHGTGGFADVFRGRWQGELVALKRLRPEDKSSHKACHSFLSSQCMLTVLAGVL